MNRHRRTYNHHQKVKALAREMRHLPTPTEDRLWQALRDHRLGGFQFRRQHPFAQFILDFYCPSKLVAIEVDGSIHQYSVEEDRLRTEFLEDNGIKVLIYSNSQITDNLPDVLSWILTALQER